MKGFLDISQVVFPIRFLEFAHEHMRKAGENYLEGVALFAGKEVNNIFYVQRAIVPKQTALSIEHGLLYSVGGEELHRINVYLYENDITMIAQIHSHPAEAYHSDTDDAYPIITTVGGLSIVVPDFASGEIKIENWAVYRLSKNNLWEEQNQEMKNSLFKIVE